MTLGQQLDTMPAAKTLNKMTIAQRSILRLLERGDKFVIVSGAYLSDVLSLQVQHLVTHSLTEDDGIRVAWAACPNCGSTPESTTRCVTCFQT